MKRWNRTDKLGAMLQDATTTVVNVAALGMGGDVANGPEDPIDWDAIAWREQEARVQRLRQRIFKAVQAGDPRQVRNLQKLMLPSRANTMVSVRRVSEPFRVTNEGRWVIMWSGRGRCAGSRGLLR